MQKKKKVLSKQQLKKIAKAREGFRYNNLMISELENLKRIVNNPENQNQKIKFINSFSEYDVWDKDTLHIILSVEGGHAFYYGKNEHSDSARLIQNLQKFKAPDAEHRLLYITLVHLERSGLGNHAYANKNFQQKNLSCPKGMDSPHRELILLENVTIRKMERNPCW